MQECEENAIFGVTCSDLFTCCDCGGIECGCPYCWSCNACDACKAAND
jgi:hypothetical protein